MKTPRELLLARHQAATPKLNSIRNEIVMELNNEETKKQSFLPGLVSLFLCCSKNFWCELIFPSRRIWAGLAIVWAFIFAVNVSQRDHSQMTLAKSSPSPEMILSFRQQEKLLAELIGQTESQVAEPPKTFLPRPSSQRRFEILVT